MQYIEIFPSRAVADATTIVLLRVTQASAVQWRKFRPGDGDSLQKMKEDAERMALERWPGGIQYRLALPMEDCGHAPADL